MLRALTRKHGTLLVIDETHTFCCGPGGYTAPRPAPGGGGLMTVSVGAPVERVFDEAAGELAAA